MISRLCILFLKKHVIWLLPLFFLVLSGCDNFVDRRDSGRATPSERPTIIFDVEIDDTKINQTPPIEQNSAARDICVDYFIETINAYVHNSENVILAEDSWSCTDHLGNITAVPAGTDYRLIVEATVDGEIKWRGEIDELTVMSGKTTEAGTVSLTYIDDELSPPIVAFTNPIDLSENVPTNIAIAATFAEDVVASSINPATFIVSAGSNQIDGTVAYDENSRTAHFTPDLALGNDTAYFAILETEIENLAGGKMESVYLWRFTTGSEADNEPPTIISVTPSDSESSVALNATATATFSESLSLSSITKSSFMLIRSDDTIISGQVSYDEPSKTAVFTPDNNLAASMVYQATITTSVTDLAGNHLASEYNWSFETESEAAEHDVTFNVNNTQFGTLMRNGSLVQQYPLIISVPYGGDCDAITAVAVGDYVFDGWSGDYIAGSEVNPLSLTNITSDITVTAEFNAESGILDQTFGTQGYVSHDKAAGGYEPTDDNRDYAIAMAVDDQGRILVYGISYNSGQQLISVVLRFNADGSLDSTFGTDGVVNLATTCRASDMVLYNNKIYLVGDCLNSTSLQKDLAVWRLSENGTLEEAEPGNPSYRFDTVQGDEKGNAIVHDGAGKMYVAGVADDGSGKDMALWCFNVTNSTLVLDTAFAANGLATHDDAAGGSSQAGKNEPDEGVYVRLHGNRIWVAGNSDEGSSTDIVIWSFDANGNLDTNFNDTGFVVVGSEYQSGSDDPADSYNVNGFAIDNQGRFVLAGRHWAPGWELATFRMNSDGLFDRTYNDTGYNFHIDVTGVSGEQDAYDLIVDQSNRIIVVGEGMTLSSGSHRDLIVVRYNEDGSLDGSFNNSGLFTFTEITGQGAFNGRRILPYSGDRAIIAGHGGLSPGDVNKDIYLWRLNLSN